MQVNMETSAVTCDPIPSHISEELKHEIEELVLSVPKERGCVPPPGLSLYQNFWFPTRFLPAVISFQRHFQALDGDILLATKPKTGTTWLKALVFSVVNRHRYLFTESPLLTSNPHDLVPFFELELYHHGKLPDLASMPFPRLFSTHCPYSVLPESVSQKNCRIVYMGRNPYDMTVSAWHFSAQQKSEYFLPLSMEEHAEVYCKGLDWFGPFWDHMLEYWNEGVKNPNKVLFLKYEDMKRDPVPELKKLANFLGFPFSEEEERDGALGKIVDLCSLKNLKDLEVNKTGGSGPLSIDRQRFFRKGEVGDWTNHLNSQMVERLEKIIKEKFGQAGLAFETSLNKVV